MVDLLIKNGDLIDGTGAGAVKLDIAISDGKIVEMAPSLDLKSDEVIDASGLVVCPGFVDIHSHTDATITTNPKAESKIRQGVTTEVVGNCGMSAAPVTSAFLSDVKDHLNNFSIADSNIQLDRSGTGAIYQVTIFYQKINHFKSHIWLVM